MMAWCGGVVASRVVHARGVTHEGHFRAENRVHVLRAPTSRYTPWESRPDFVWTFSGGCINVLIQTMQIRISESDGVPIYLQIVNQVKYLVGAGRLEAGEELPPIRVL